MGKRVLTLMSLVLLFTVGARADDSAAVANAWQLDAAHSNIGFAVSHLVISEVEGEFTDFSGEVKFDPNDIGNSWAKLTIQAASIDTDNTKRDHHLKSDDFLNAEKYPTITFVTREIKKTGDNSFAVTGDMTIRDVTREVTLTGEHSEVITDPWGNRRIGFKMQGTIDRQKFNVKWSETLDTGGLVAGNEVKLEIDGELVKPTKKG